MKEKITERIEIIDSYKSIVRYNERSPEQQYRYIRWLGSVELVIGLLSLLLLISISFIKVLNINVWTHRWENAGLLVLLLVASSLWAQFLFIEKMLKSHRRKIQDMANDFDESLNTDLQRTVSRISSKAERIGIAYHNIMSVVLNISQVEKVTI